MKEDDVKNIDDLEKFYEECETTEMRKEFIRNYVKKTLHSGTISSFYEFKAVRALLDFDESIPRLYGDVEKQKPDAPLVERQTQ